MMEGIITPDHWSDDLPDLQQNTGSCAQQLQP